MVSLLRQRVAMPMGGEEPLTWKALPEWVAGAVDEARSGAGAEMFVRETRMDPGIPLRAIDSRVEDAAFFATRDSIALGLGKAKGFEFETLPGPEKMGSALRLGSSVPPHVRLFGGWAFSAKAGEGPWRNFPRSAWTIPALAFTSARGRTDLTVAILPESKEVDLRRYYGRLAAAAAAAEAEKQMTNEGKGAVRRTAAHPSKREWVSLVEGALGSISDGQLEKVVVSRQVRLSLAGGTRLSRILERLMRANRDSTTFAVKRGDTTFVGATPERLLSLRGREIAVDCLAASAPRGRDPTLDRSLGRRLLRDRKSRREHGLVVESVRRSLSPICDHVDVPNVPRLKRLATVQHLYTPVRGRLRGGHDIWSAAFALWPTPAVAGEPKEEAVRWIEGTEPFRRGWYSGVVGVVSPDGDGDLAVAIRSGVVGRSEATLFAGSGIVAGSDPGDEFEETEWKMQTMLDAISPAPAPGSEGRAGGGGPHGHR